MANYEVVKIDAEQCLLQPPLPGVWPMSKKFVAGILLGALFVYLSFRNIRWEDVLSRLAAIDLFSLTAALLVIILIQFVRVLRWGIILSPLTNIGKTDLIIITNIGLFSVVALPARLGEFIRAYLAAKKTSLPLSSVLATIVVERVMDSLSILLMAGLLLIFIPLPPWLIKPAIIFSFVTIALVVSMMLVIVKRKILLQHLSPFIDRHLGRSAAKISDIIKSFINGFNVLRQDNKLIQVALLSGFIWLLHVLVISILFQSFGFDLPILAPFFLNVILILGIAIPAAPGFIGNWHYATIVGLGFFGIAESEALSLAIVHHFLALGVVVLMGLLSLPFSRVSLLEVKSQQPD